MNVYIIEDNPFYRDKLLKSIEKFSQNVEYVFRVESQIATAKAMSQQELVNGPHVYILDIDLKENLNGIDLGKLIRQRDPYGYIIYLTSMENRLATIINEYIAPLAFFSKSIEEAEIVENIQIAFQRIKEQEELRNGHDFFLFKRGSQQAKILYRDILYFEKIPRSKKVSLYTTAGVFTINQYLSTIKEELNVEEFISTNSFIFSISSIQSIDAVEDKITFKDGSTLYIGKHIFRKVKKEFSNYLC